MGGFFDTISGNKESRKNTRRAVNIAAFDPFQISTPFGSGSITNEGIQIGSGPGAGLAPGFESLASNLLGQAGQLPLQGLGISPDQAAALGMQAGQAGAGFTGAANQALGGISSFNLGEFIQNRFDTLQGLARPGEERAVGSLGANLLARGRLGGEDTRSGRAFAELDEAQARAETQRFIDAEQSGMQHFLSQIGGAGQLAGIGEQVSGGSLQRFLSALGGGQQVATGQQQLFQALLGGAGGATQGIQQAFAPTRDAIQTLLAGSGLQRQTDLTQAKIQAGFDPTKGAEAAGGAAAGLVGGIFSDLDLKENIQFLGEDGKGRGLWSWEWNDRAKEIGVDGMPTRGYIAQELLESDPHAVRVHDTGYLMVNLEVL